MTSGHFRIDRRRGEDRAIESDHKYSTRHSADLLPRSERRRSPRRPRRILGLWARLTFLGLAVIVLSLAAIGLVAKAIRPYREASAQTQQLSETQRQIDTLNSQNAALRRKIAYLKTPQGITTEARAMGYHKPGEIPIVVEGAPLSPPLGSEAASSAPDVPARADSRLRRLWRRLTGH